MTGADHAAEAREFLEASQLAASQHELPAATLAVQHAQAHALLALVEQQRIATLVRLATYSGDYDENIDLLRAEAADALVRWVPHAPDDEHPEVRPEIARALGLSNDNEETNE